MARGAGCRAGRGNDVEAAFARLQARLRPAAALDATAGAADGTVFVIPSIDLDDSVLNRHARELAALEERSLCLLFALRRADVRLVVVTSRPVRAEVLEYYLRLIPEAAEARSRVELLSPGRLSKTARAEDSRAIGLAGSSGGACPGRRSRVHPAVQRPRLRAQSRAETRHPDLRHRSSLCSLRDQDGGSAVVRMRRNLTPGGSRRGAQQCGAGRRPHFAASQSTRT
jgi:hypothetical protein